MALLSSLLTPRRIEKSHYALDVPDGWQQGRGAFGGFVIGALVRTLELELEGDGRELRSLSAVIAGPVMPGRAELRTEIFRAGNAVTSAAVRLSQGEGVLAHGVGVLGKARTKEFDRPNASAPKVPHWESVETIPVEPPLGPDFAKHFEFRNLGPLPYSGEAPGASGYIRPKDPGPDRGPAYIAACIDAWWPTLFASLEAPRPMATIDFTLHFVSDLKGLPDDAPLFYRAHCMNIREGYLVEHRELWGIDGRLIALNQQTFVVIK